MIHELRVLEAESEIQQALRLRVRVWREAKANLPADAAGCHVDPDDAAATHVGVLSGGRLVAASRMSVLPAIGSLSFARQLSLDPARHAGPVSFLSRLVVAPEARGRGLARSLIEWTVTRAHEHGAAWTAATTSVRPVEVVLASLRFDHADDVRLGWGDGWRDTSFFIADAGGAALEVRARGGRHAIVRRDPDDEKLAVTGAANVISPQGGP